MRKSIFLPLTLLFAIVTTTSVWADGKGAHRRHVDRLRVMTKNLYVGADLLGVNDPRPCGALQAVHDLFEEILASNPPERMDAIADEIMRKRPHVIALQEVYRLSMQVPSNSIKVDSETGAITFDHFRVNDNGTITFKTDADHIVYDYLELLLDALAARGLQYDVVEDAIAYESDFEFPSWHLVQHPDFGCIPADGAFPTDVRAEDRDVILVRSDVTADNATWANYSWLVPIQIPTGEAPAPIVQIISVRGFSVADITHRGQTYRFVNTHLEVDDQSDPNSPINMIQAAQAQELIAVLSSETLSQVVTGDFNSSPDPRDVTTSYELMQAAGYTDIWPSFRWRPGYTCCQADDLMNFSSLLSKRVDLVLTLPAAETELLWSPARVTGNRQRDKTASGLWPSDHAGVAALLRFRQ